MLHDDFAELFRTLKREGEARAIVLTGGEQRAFSAGGDFDLVPAAARRSTRSTTCGARRKQIIWDLLDVEVPIVCALNGSAAGLGASIALLCDVIVMSDARVDRRPARQRRPRRRRRRGGGLAAAARAAGREAAPAARRAAARRRGAAPRRRRRGVRAGRGATTARSPGPSGSPPSRRSPCAAPRSPSTQQLKRALLDSFDLSTALEIPCFLSRDHAEAVDAIRRATHTAVRGEMT